MKILLDGNSIQVQHQKQTSTRLNTLLGAIASAGASTRTTWTVQIASPITTQSLSGVDVYVDLTRNTANPFQQSEIDAITTFVNGGGNAMIFSNHPGFTAGDVPLAAAFGVTLQSDFVSNPTVGGQTVHPMRMTFDPPPCLTTSLAGSILFEVSSLVSHDSCVIVPPSNFLPIAVFPPTAVVSPSGSAPSSPYFAIVVTPTSTMKGQVIVTGNSGFVCDNGNESPSCGLAPYGNNLLFFLNCLRYLTAQTQPAPGFCPGQTPKTGSICGS